jgi:hypothetical protein
MTVSIKKHYKHAPVQEQIEFKRVMDAVLADSTALRAAFVALTAKMDADFADVTNASTDYAASVDPAALTLVS